MNKEPNKNKNKNKKTTSLVGQEQSKYKIYLVLGILKKCFSMNLNPDDWKKTRSNFYKIDWNFILTNNRWWIYQKHRNFSRFVGSRRTRGVLEEYRNDV